MRERYIEQGELYASREKIHWLLLTNGVDWNLYHLTFSEGIKYELVFAVTLSKDSCASAAEKIGLLHRSSVRSGEHDEFWKKVDALSAESIGHVLFTEPVMRLIRREIRRKENVPLDIEDVARAIHSLFTPDVQQKIGPPRIRVRRTTKPQFEQITQPPVLPAIPTMPATPCANSPMQAE